MDLFLKYQSLFNAAENCDRIGVCKWVESGTTIDTALPGLRNLTDDKEEWRAVIIRYIDENSMAEFKSDPRNPYDFLSNRNNDHSTIESSVPLVRLTQMLGGVPPLEVMFNAEIVREKGKAPRTVYVPIVDEPREQAHNALVEKYRFDGKAPSAVLIISVRDKRQQEENIGRVWLAHKESESSEFWKRNQFPSICRFMVYDFEKKGPIQKEADDFDFWYTVMLISINEWDSGTIQAYRLYSLRIDMDKVNMSESFQVLVNKLKDVKYTIRKSIQRDTDVSLDDEVHLPDYQISISVPVKLPKVSECVLKHSSFPLFSQGAQSDIAIWYSASEDVENRLSNLISSVERKLDQTVEKMRTQWTFSDEDTVMLSKYQEEDLRHEVDGLSHKIMAAQRKLPNSNISENEELGMAAEDIKKYLCGRVTKGPALFGVLITSFLIVLSAAPAVVKYFSYGEGSLSALIFLLVGGIAVVALCALCALLIQKFELNSYIIRYNLQLRKAFDKLVKNASEYSVYISGLANHSRGSSYLNQSAKKKNSRKSEHYSKYKYIKTIDVMLGRLDAWSRAFRLVVDFDSHKPEMREGVDTSVPIEKNRMFSFVTGSAHTIPLNNSGIVMEAPYCFASKIEIIREELYEDE